MKSNSHVKKSIIILVAIVVFGSISVGGAINRMNTIDEVSNSKALILTASSPYFSNSSLTTIELGDHSSVDEDIYETHGDDEVRYYNGKVYILNRFGYDYIEVFDAEHNFEKELTISTGEGTNPQDIAIISDTKAYVSCYDTSDLLIVDPSNGEQLGTIDLSDYADDDGIPEMHKMVEFKIFGKSRVYLTVQRLDRNNWFEPTNESYIIELDGDNDNIINAIELTGTNPSTAPILDGHYVVVGEVGSWFSFDGGIERVNILTNKAEGFILEESEIQGNILDFEITPRFSKLKGLVFSLIESLLGKTIFNRDIFIIKSDLGFNTSLISYNLKDQIITDIFDTTGYNLVDLAINENELFVADRSSEVSGIRIFDTDNKNQITDDPISVGQYPPVHITFI